MALGKKFDIKEAIQKKGEVLDNLPKQTPYIKEPEVTISPIKPVEPTQPIKKPQPIKKERQIQVSTRIPKEALEQFNAKYAKKGLTIAQVMRTLLMEDLEKQ